MRREFRVEGLSEPISHYTDAVQFENLLFISGVSRYLTRNAPCPIDPEKARACLKLRRIGFGIFTLSLFVYGIGFFFAFLARYFL